MKQSITKEEISRLEVEEFSGRVVVVESADDVEAAINKLSQFEVLGFDTETRPSYKKGNTNGVALIQLSTDDTCFLFRLNKIGLPTTLVDLLSDPCIKKIGLSLRDDFLSINRRAKLSPQGFVDLQKLVPEFNITDISLQKVYALVFNKKISKGQRLTNWEADILSESQKKYAALDAWACLKIYQQLVGEQPFN